jgi:DNA-3-methyladenine glycosylase II
LNYTYHLKKDKRLDAVLASQSVLTLQIQADLFSYLCRSIISQQLSTKVAAVISERFFLIFQGKKHLANQILAKQDEALRAVGLSNAKTQYIKNLASFYLEHKKAWSALHTLQDIEIVAFLTNIKGVGRWTVEMLLMFAMGREDIFPDDDLGIQQAMIRLYKLQADSKKELKIKMNQIASRWSPYRTYACLHLWKWKDA